MRSSWAPTISLGSHQNIGLHTGARANVVLLTYLLAEYIDIEINYYAILMIFINKLFCQTWIRLRPFHDEPLLPIRFHVDKIGSLGETTLPRHPPRHSIRNDLITSVIFRIIREFFRTCSLSPRFHKRGTCNTTLLCSFISFTRRRTMAVRYRLPTPTVRWAGAVRCGSGSGSGSGERWALAFGRKWCSLETWGGARRCLTEARAPSFNGEKSDKID